MNGPAPDHVGHVERGRVEQAEAALEVRLRHWRGHCARRLNGSGVLTAPLTG